MTLYPGVVQAWSLSFLQEAFFLLKPLRTIVLSFCFSGLEVSLVPFLYIGHLTDVQLYVELLVPVPCLMWAQSSMSYPFEGMKHQDPMVYI